jgi:Domain of unknown function (DUF4386)
MTQRGYARLAGFLFLWLIATGLAEAITLSRIVGSGTFAEQAARVAASQRLYRIALCSGLVETLSVIVLAFALYVTLKPVDRFLAQMAMYWRFLEGFIGAVGVIFAFARLGAYISRSEMLVELTRNAGAAVFNIATLSFSIGSALFYYVFFKSRYIPRLLSGFGLFASIVVMVLSFVSLISPEDAATFQYVEWAPMAVAEVGTGLWLMFGKLQPMAVAIGES